MIKSENGMVEVNGFAPAILSDIGVAITKFYARLREDLPEELVDNLMDTMFETAIKLGKEKANAD